MPVLHRLREDGRHIRCIENLYLNQSADIKIDGEQCNKVQIYTGVRQGCVLSPLLFNLYSENIFQEALENVETGIKVNGTCINHIRYADDTVLIADNMCDLQHFVNVVGEHNKEMGLKINANKTKYIHDCYTSTRHVKKRGTNIGRIIN